MRIEGEVGGDLRIVARVIEIGPEAKIGGKLIYHSPQLAKIDATAVIAGGVTHVPTDWSSGQLDSLARVATWISLVLLVLSLLVVGAIMIVAFPKFSARGRAHRAFGSVEVAGPRVLRCCYASRWPRSCS